MRCDRENGNGRRGRDKGGEVEEGGSRAYVWGSNP